MSLTCYETFPYPPKAYILNRIMAIIIIVIIIIIISQLLIETSFSFLLPVNSVFLIVL